MKNYIVLLFAALTSVCFTSCNSNVLFDKSENVSKNVWSKSDIKTFKVKVKDIDRVDTYRFAVNLCNTTDYKYNNIYFFLTTIYPDGSVTVRDTIQCELTDITGEWKGKGRFDTKDNRFWFANNVKLDQKGEYIFRLEQATRDTNLCGIESVGLHIEKMPSK
ncbi:MAG: gliding motility lipoprotein GldH [Bacteroidales bacterium]|nr:gliding motility lipoprotein GldH [Candidatus Scybalousia scybalohippi]MCQ2327408.1 gliding motility lipoprotein GldH [Bacteroidales bacterium]